MPSGLLFCTVRCILTRKKWNFTDYMRDVALFFSSFMCLLLVSELADASRKVLGNKDKIRLMTRNCSLSWKSALRVRNYQVPSRYMRWPKVRLLNQAGIQISKFQDDFLSLICLHILSFENNYYSFAPWFELSPLVLNPPPPQNIVSHERGTYPSSLPNCSSFRAK